MRPDGLRTKIFLDSGDPQETREAISLLGFLDGQTTNPSLVAKNPAVREKFARGEKFSREEIFYFYRKVVQEISGLIPDGSVSVEVYSDANTSAGEMFDKGKEMFDWVPNAHIKFPITEEGLAAAERAIWEGLRVNMTLCFSESQAAAVYAATRGAMRGDIFISPFIGRLDDIKENGMDLIKNIVRLYGESDGHVEILAASIRNIDHFLESIQIGADIITAPLKVLKEWSEGGFVLPEENFTYNPKGLKNIPYRGFDLGHNWQSYDVKHDLTDKGVERFAADWNALLK